MLSSHWGRVMHTCVGKLTIIGSDNGLSPGRRQAIIWTNTGILLIRPLGTNFSEIFIRIQTFSFKKMHLKMASAKWRPFCLGLNVLKLNMVLLMQVYVVKPIIDVNFILDIYLRRIGYCTQKHGCMFIYMCFLIFICMLKICIQTRTHIGDTYHIILFRLQNNCTTLSVYRHGESTLGSVVPFHWADSYYGTCGNVICRIPVHITVTS